MVIGIFTGIFSISLSIYGSSIAKYTGQKCKIFSETFRETRVKFGKGKVIQIRR